MPSRTKACAICRKKRIRCDATLPQCLMCIRFGRECPGVADGPLIVDMTQTAKHGMQKRKIKVPPKNNEIVAWHQSNPDDSAVYRMSQRAMVTEAFYERFLTYFTSEGDGKDIRNRLTWLHRLPLLSTDGTDEALVLALQATASAYCAADSANVALTRHAWNLYGDALRIHGRSVGRSRPRHDVTIHMVSTSVLCSLFEAMQATSANAYRSHIYGAAKMLGGDRARSVYTGRAMPNLLPSPDADGIRALDGQRTRDASGSDEDPVRYAGVYAAADVPEVDGSRCDAGGDPLDLATYMLIRSEVDVLWHEYTQIADDRQERLSWEDVSTGATKYRDAFTALTIAYFESARVLLAIVAPQLAASFVDLTDHYTVIMETSHYLQIFDIGCAYMRMATPLLLVALHSPRMEQRRSAISCFESWGNGSMKGISALALKSIYRQYAIKPQLNVRYSSAETVSTLLSEESFSSVSSISSEGMAIKLQEME